MATPENAHYKMAQQSARSNSRERVVFSGLKYKPAQAIRDGKLNKKSGRRLATGYK